MYDQISCKGMDGLNGIFDDQARERNINFIWVAQDLMDPRTISRRDMREQINKYMTTVLQEEPVDPTLVDFDDTLAWFYEIFWWMRCRFNLCKMCNS